MPRLRILVLGASGFIGPAVLRRAVARGHEPIAASRGGATSIPGTDAVALDRRDLDAVTDCIRTRRVDVVIDLLAYTTQSTLPVMARLAGRLNRYVMASSGDVYRQYDLLHRREVGAPLPKLNESAPLRTRLFPYRSEVPRAPSDPDAWMDDYDKIPIEQALAATEGLSWSALRLPMVYGPGDRNRRLAWALGHMSGAVGLAKIDEEWANWRTSLGFVDDVAEGLVLAAEHPQAHGRIFNLGPSEVKTNLEWAQDLAAILGWKGELLLVPRDHTPEPTHSRLAALDLTVPVVLDTAAVRRELGYSEVVNSAEALLATIQADRTASGAGEVR